MTAPATTTSEAPGTTPRRTGQQVELARYAVPGAERRILGPRVKGTVIVIDAPAGDEGRVYLVERGLEQDGNTALKALVEDYLQVASALAIIPMTAHTT